MSTIKIVRFSSQKLNRYLLILLGVLITPSVFAADQFKSLDFSEVGLYAKIEWKEEPKLNEESKFNLSFGESPEDLADGEFVDPGYDVAIKLWMPNCYGGHPSAPVTLKRVSAGVYEVSKAYFIMAGNWDVVVTLKKNEKLIDVSILKVTVE